MVHNTTDGKRYDINQIRDIFLNRTGAVLTCGFARLVDQGDARSSHERAAGFMEDNISMEYCIAMGALQPLIIESEPVELQGAEKAAFWLSVGFGNGSPLPQASGKFNIYINDVFCLSVRNVNYSFYWCGEKSEFAFGMRRCETAAPYASMQLSPLIKDESQVSFGLGLLLADKSLVKEGQPAVIKIEPVSEFESSRYFYLSKPPNAFFQGNIWHAAEVLEARNTGSSGKYKIFFGDIHTHSGQLRDRINNEGCGRGSMEDNYRYAKGPGGLHFYALTDHEYQLLPDYEEEYFNLADKYNKDNEFVCLKAYEFSSSVYGHRNIYFKDKAKVINNTDTNRAPVHPEDLMNQLSNLEFFSVPHHPSSASHPFNANILFEHDRCVEVYSSWGSSEYWGDFPRGVSDRHDRYWVRDMLKAQHVLGIIASADGHDGHPGNAQSPFPKHKHLFHFCGSGLTAVLCDSLTRDNVYEAIKNRRCYATTGAPILLDISCNGYVMGSIIPGSASKPEITISCRGTNAIKEIRIIKNGDIRYVHQCCGAHTADFNFTDTEYNGEAANYYIRVVQEDRESAWSSPFFISAAL